jgi:hypothetical protein
MASARGQVADGFGAQGVSNRTPSPAPGSHFGVKGLEIRTPPARLAKPMSQPWPNAASVIGTANSGPSIASPWHGHGLDGVGWRRHGAGRVQRRRVAWGGEVSSLRRSRWSHTGLRGSGLARSGVGARRLPRSGSYGLSIPYPLEELDGMADKGWQHRTAGLGNSAPLP